MRVCREITGTQGLKLWASAEEGEQFIRMKHKKKSTAMELSDQIISQEMKIKKLEMELNDLRQGLATVQDYYYDLLHVSEKQEATESIEQEVVQPQHDEDRESDRIWSFFQERLIADPAAHISRAEMYDAFVRYDAETSQYRIEQGAFEFVFARITDPPPLFTRGEWIGYRLK
jgi:vacuolar-type H+-ATPase subunit I/STV1